MKLNIFRAISSAASRRALGALAATLALALAPAGSARAAEHQLAGIRVFASVHDILARYGNPNRIITDPSQFSSTTTSSSGVSAQTGAPGMSGMMGMGMRGRMGMGMGMGMSPATEFGASGAPDGPGMANPYAPPGSPGGSSSETGTANPTAGEVMYVYNRPGNVTYDFLLSPDGRVIQITVLGYKSSGIKTGRGIQLGTLYSTMIGRYGYPEGQSTSNSVLTATYINRAHASFQLRNNHVVGITVAAVE